jgi:hypothetical protein
LIALIAENPGGTACGLLKAGSEDFGDLVVHVPTKSPAVAGDIFPDGGAVLALKEQGIDAAEDGGHCGQKQQVSHSGLFQLG